MINNKKSNQAGHHLGAYILPLLSWFVFQSTSAAAADDSQNEHAITYSGEVARIINEIAWFVIGRAVSAQWS